MMKLSTTLLRRCWFLTGPTAVGKTQVALALAKRLDAEIISLDSMSLYQGMDVGTAKPTPEQRRTVPHHLIDLLEPGEEHSVAEYVSAAGTACDSIVKRGGTPLFVGGTALYLRSLLRGVFDGPPADWAYRRVLQREAGQQDDSETLHRRLQKVDPTAAARLHPHDHRRVVRALEVFRLTGRPISQQQRQEPLPPGERPEHVYWLSPPRDWLYDRINRRVEEMFAGGLTDEVRSLLANDRQLSRSASQALGYKEVVAFLQGSETLEATIERVQTRTRRFAKRQCTWFRNLEECQEIEMTGTENANELAEKVLAAALSRKPVTE
jgi:tRNA dimethylallyltransferase